MKTFFAVAAISLATSIGVMVQTAAINLDATRIENHISSVDTVL